MKIPKFKPANDFLGETLLPCLVAKVRNSQLPGVVATRFIKLRKDDPVCTIYLRAKEPKKISDWQHEILKRLFVKANWIPAIDRDLKKYEADLGDDLFIGIDEKETSHFEKLGLLAYFAVDRVVIDDIKHKVFATFDTSKFDEHGLALYLSKNRWRLGSWDLYSRYYHSFDAAVLAKDEARWDKRLKRWHKQWAGVFPIPKPGTPTVPDLSDLCGIWEYDRRVTARILKRIGLSRDEVKKTLAYPPSSKFCISAKNLKEHQPVYGVSAWRVSKIARWGSTVRIDGTYKGKNRSLHAHWIYKFCYYRNLMAEEGGSFVYRRVKK